MNCVFFGVIVGVVGDCCYGVYLDEFFIGVVVQLVGVGCLVVGY